MQRTGLPARRPRAPPMRPLAEAAFVYEDDRSALFLSFFLISGQRLCFHSVDEGFVSLQGAAHRLLHAPVQLPQDAPDVSGMITDFEVLSIKSATR